MKKYSFLIVSLVCLFTACKKELSDNFITYGNNPLNDTIWVRSIPSTAAINQLVDLLKLDIAVDSFDLAQGDTIRIGDSLEVDVPANSCSDAQGNVLTGKARMEILRLKTKGDFIKAFKPTTSNGYLLETAGGFFARIIKDGVEQSLAPNAVVRIRFSDNTAPKPNMKVFYARETIPFPQHMIDTIHTWQPDTDTSWISTFQITGTNGTINGYDLAARKLRWISAARYTDSTLPKTKITAILSPNFTDKNTVVFAVFANQKTVVGLSPDFASRSFTANNIPLKSKITLVSISYIGTDFYLGVKDINDVGTVTHYVVEPQKQSLVQILTYLNSL